MMLDDRTLNRIKERAGAVSVSGDMGAVATRYHNDAILLLREVEELRERNAALEAVVQDLADSDFWSDDFRCRYCNTHTFDPHAEDCLRRRAVELMKGR